MPGEAISATGSALAGTRANANASAKSACFIPSSRKGPALGGAGLEPIVTRLSGSARAPEYVFGKKIDGDLAALPRATAAV
ncbi:hypothetical protein GCM10008942_13150 [Rhizomicrobium electricum]|uniref:Uncharacterized protein n=1 Tax=Rhizomicrobium electricum TaxID=480070 RepID=A0ABN1EGG1_9PROT